jgi:cytochrome d ubiquinol oxidase subunit I
MDDAETRYALRIPGGLSFLAFGDFDAEVKGLEEFPRDQWPHVHLAARGGPARTDRHRHR